MELALACDILVGDETVCFRDTHVKFHLAPCWGLSQRLSRRIGPGRAKWVSLGAIPIPAVKAYEWGLLDELVLTNVSENEPQQGNSLSLNRALEIADSIGMNSSTMVMRYKRVIDEGWKTTLEQGLQRERALALAHYIEAVGDGSTFESAKSFISKPRQPSPRL
jgi:enoyl-CoA hydratase